MVVCKSLTNLQIQLYCTVVYVTSVLFKFLHKKIGQSLGLPLIERKCVKLLLKFFVIILIRTIYLY
ncbi:hypothetical protein STAPHY8AQ_20336 [Staphylococcus sp. 8AQ]|nr:hypothetical protein STAPHY8AQ_20336 [Staphylococcus sp. 8AQ]